MNETSKVLVVDDEAAFRETMSRQLSRLGCLSATADKGKEALQVLQTGDFDVAFIDLGMPDMDGLAMLAAMEDANLDTVPVVISGRGDVSSAVDAMKHGAFDFVEKVPDVRVLRRAIDRATSHRRAVRQARQMETVSKQWESMFDASIDPIVVSDLDGRILRCNAAAGRRAGKPHGDLSGCDCHEALCGNKHPIEPCPFAAGPHDQETLTQESALWGGFYEISGVLLRNEDGHPWGRMWMARDVTERRRAHDALMRSEERYRALFQSSRDAINTLEPPTWRFSAGNPACVAMFRTEDEASFTSLGPWELSPERQPDGRPSAEKAKEMIETAMREGSHSFEWRHKRTTGEEFPATVLLTRVEIGDCAFLQATVRDVSVEKRLEEQLRTSEEKFRRIVDNIGVGVSLINQQMQVLELNGQMRGWFPAVRPEEKPLCHEAFNTPPVQETCVECPTTKTLQDGKRHEGSVIRPQEDGDHTYRIVSSPIHGSDGQVAAAIEMVEDITDRLRIEHELRQSQKLEAVGRLAAGIAHEINTPTQYVGDNLEFLQTAFEELETLCKASRTTTASEPDGDCADGKHVDPEEAIPDEDVEFVIAQVPRAISQSLEGIQRIASIVGAMKEFSHPGTEEKEPVDLNHLIDSTITVSRNEWKYVADVETHFDTTLSPVPCLPGEFNQVILNLLVNAAHAIRDALGEDSQEKGGIAISTRRQDGWVEIRISDTGPGIPQEIRDRIFDPFFTTKEVGRGTGQGLAIARNIIVEKHGGSLDFQTEAGEGTTFLIRLPLQEVEQDE